MTLKELKCIGPSFVPGDVPGGFASVVGRRLLKIYVQGRRLSFLSCRLQPASCLPPRSRGGVRYDKHSSPLASASKSG
jgi:hypothetical protein